MGLQIKDNIFTESLILITAIYEKIHYWCFIPFTLLDNFIKHKPLISEEE